MPWITLASTTQCSSLSTCVIYVLNVHVWVSLCLQAFAKARSEALARVGSRSLAADFITQLLLWAGSAAWLPAPVLSAVLDLVADDPNDGQGELVTAAFDMLQKLAKVITA